MVSTRRARLNIDHLGMSSNNWHNSIIINNITFFCLLPASTNNSTIAACIATPAQTPHPILSDCRRKSTCKTRSQRRTAVLWHSQGWWRAKECTCRWGRPTIIYVPYSHSISQCQSMIHLRSHVMIRIKFIPPALYRESPGAPLESDRLPSFFEHLHLECYSLAERELLIR